MKKIALGLLLAMPLLSGCDYWLFHLVATVDKNQTYSIDQTGAFSKSVVIGPEDIRDAIDVPEDGRITEVDVESLSLRVVIKDGNEATALRVNGLVYDAGQDKTQMFSDYPIPLSVANPLTGDLIINDLIANGVSKLRSKLNGFVKGLDDTAFLLELAGDSFPAGQRIQVDLILRVKATVKYDQCQAMPWGLTSDEECAGKGEFPD